MIPKVGGAILGPGDLNNMHIKSGGLKWSYSQNLFFAYLNEGPFLTQSLTHLSCFYYNFWLSSGHNLVIKALATQARGPGVGFQNIADFSLFSILPH